MIFCVVDDFVPGKLEVVMIVAKDAEVTTTLRVGIGGTGNFGTCPRELGGFEVV